jgi:hypothetical protein
MKYFIEGERPVFVYSREDSSNKISVSVEDNNKYRNFCVLTCVEYSKVWRITFSQSYEKYLQQIKFTNFDSKEQAAEFFYYLISQCEALATTKALPIDVEGYLVEKSRNIRTRIRRLEDERIQLEKEMYELNKIAARNQIEQLEYITESFSPPKLIKKLMDFKIDTEFGCIPFFSETYLNSILNKEITQSILSLLQDLSQKITSEDEIEGKYELELEKISKIMQSVHPIGKVKHIGLMECATALQQVVESLPNLTK